MQKAGLVLEDEGDLTAYLGISVERSKGKNGSKIKLSQPFPIEIIIKAVGLNGTDKRVKHHNAPADKTPRHKLASDPDPKEEFHYRSVIGMLNYLAQSTRPDISFATHQAAKFCSNPSRQHEEAVKRICRYLAGTKTEGLILRPRGTSFDCYADADFAGAWSKIDPCDKNTVQSRSGYIVTYGDCPIIWASKVQTEIALSTTEAEFVSLSQGLREVKFLLKIFDEVFTHKIIKKNSQPKVHCRLFEDNTGAIEVAKEPKLRPRTKHLAVKLFHFLEHVERKIISIHYIDTKEQNADIFTKPLPRPAFEKLRRKICGW